MHSDLIEVDHGKAVKQSICCANLCGLATQALLKCCSIFNGVQSVISLKAF